MAVQMTYTQTRANLAKLLDKVTQDRETVIIERRQGGRAALIAADELVALLETAHLLRSPKNAQRLLAALQGALSHRSRPMSVDELRGEIGLDRGKP
ncbi:MAG TPA: type II toxin-antitoxin system Phd/YefM family antitoxin [Candidatus Desulfaltia sp.]|nr:type II toxin-antitoxin system Phd/YefM family antitoxin [Candidatus Desulfaltia sp.]